MMIDFDIKKYEDHINLMNTSDLRRLVLQFAIISASIINDFIEYDDEFVVKPIEEQSDPDIKNLMFMLNITK